MGRDVRLRELLIGIEGLALHRRLYDGTDAEAKDRLTEIGQVLADSAYSSREPVHEASPQSGYQSWSVSYDDPGNPIVELEQPAVWSYLDDLEPGSVLDAA